MRFSHLFLLFSCTEQDMDDKEHCTDRNAAVGKVKNVVKTEHG